ncbi:hypothetical protein [Lysobacter sp. CA196]|uniref:hypothetical protein n=1 Tax=Lysobacter sp. CA196 TaxID=3455606 RepID=UPI003F8D80AB
MPVLTAAQLQGLASNHLGAGSELVPGWADPNPDAPCWGYALFGGPGGHAANTPPTIFDQAWSFDGEENDFVLNPGFVDWVHDNLGNADADAQAQVLAANAATARNDAAPGSAAAKQACTRALARLCMIASGLTLSGNDGAAPTQYSIVMASDLWRTWEHWALGLANNVGAPDNPAVQYTQRDAGVNPVNTRCGIVWGNHPILTTLYVTELLPGHIEYLQHAVGWP